MPLFASHSKRALWRLVLPAGMVAAACLFADSALAHGSTQDPLLTRALEQIKMHQYRSAMPPLLQLANHGNAAAMRELGLIYAGGMRGRTPDPKWGLQWFQRAATGGDVASAGYIGDLYAGGALGTPDLSLARFWYRKGYAKQDAYGAMGLAELACGGSGQKPDLAECRRLLAAADSLPRGDGIDIKDRLATDWGALGGAYVVTGAQTRALAASAYRRSAALGDGSSAVAESNLYLRPNSTSLDLFKAAAALNRFVTPYRVPDGRIYSMPAYGDIGDQYVKIGDAFQAMGPAQTVHAVPVYAVAAQLGKPEPAIRLAMRYAQADGVGRSLSAAAKQLLALAIPMPGSPQADEYLAALQFVANAYVQEGPTAANKAAAKPLLARAAKIGIEPLVEAVSSASPHPPTSLGSSVSSVQDRFPNMIAPPTVKPLQKFPVMVSLNATQFDKNTVVVSGGRPGGEVRITLLPGITAVQIGVVLVAPAMTSVDGLYMQNIELTVNQDSTTAVFQMQAGTGAGTSPIFATLTYNGAFLAQIRRDVVVADAVVARDAPAPGSPLAAHVILSAPPANLTAPVPPTTSAAPIAPPVTPIARRVTPVAPRIQIDPEQRAPDMTIQEVQVGDSLSYTVYAPGFGFAGPTLVTGAAQRQAIVARLYSDLEAQGNVLDQIGGKAASQQAKDFAEGKGNDLYDKMAPDAFKTMYQKMKTAGSPPRTIQVLTSNPSLPWELLRPILDAGTREDFLGTTVAIATVDAASIPREPPPTAASLQAVRVIAPLYNGDTALKSAQDEVIALKKFFPALEQVEATASGVEALGTNLPHGIIHFAGHGTRVLNPGLPPDVGLVLNGTSLLPSTWRAWAEKNPQAHPFYFFNACDQGRSDATLDYISGWASALMQSGASGYLGALWRVSDTTAESFAAHFYKDLRARMDTGDPWSISEVVTQARRETYMEAYDPTALSYILYADPYETMTDRE